VSAESPTIDDFKRIFARCCAERDLPYNISVVEALIEDVYLRRGIPLRGSHPRDLIDHALSLADYFGAPRELTLELLKEACAGYFVDEEARPQAAV
jgi:hypothetical protein